MLIISRKKDEGLIIGDNISVRILEVSGDTVKIGIEAPRQIPVHREEIYKRIQEANIQAATSPLPAVDLLKRFKKEPPPTT